jgi:LysM repeat protein
MGIKPINFWQTKRKGGVWMEFFVQNQLTKDSDGYVLTFYLNPMLTEFAKEIVGKEGNTNSEELDKNIKDYISNRFPNIKINAIKIMMGSLLVATFTFVGAKKEVKAATVSQVQMAQVVEQGVKTIIHGKTYQFAQPVIVKNGTMYVPIREVSEALGGNVWYNSTSKTVGINKGESKIAFVVGSSMANINGKQVPMEPSFSYNGSTMVPLKFIGEVFGMTVNWGEATKTITISTFPLTYTVQSGDTLWKIADAYGTTITELQTVNNLSNTTLSLGQKLTIAQKAASVPQTIKTYTVISGDTLWKVSNQFSISVEDLKRINNLSTDALYIGQILSVSAAQAQTTVPKVNTVTYMTYKIQSGDNIWNLSLKYGLPMTELLSVNKLTMNSSLSIGQEIKIPIHTIAIQPTVSSRHGEYLDWWTEAQYVFTIGKVATVTDFQTGKTFQIKRTIGANHADCEPLTAKDAAIIKEVWGGAYSWKERAIIVEVDGRKIAASMASMPHDIEFIKDNDFTGHFDIHFKNSTRHVDGLVSEAHQRQIKIAAGISGI